MAHLGDRVRALRDERYLSQAELALKAGVSKNTLNRIETGKTVAIQRTVRKLAEALGVQPHALAAPAELRELRGNARAA